MEGPFPVKQVTAEKGVEEGGREGRGMERVDPFTGIGGGRRST